ncbi:hypothetical protein DPMN_178479 [Dreissena polymorpha]|uniref:Uncharacterized protein n=1 Tax=Dreissena polymorpha TaxID=45954 RepID=A0A9D4ECZ1_DREPO|nr:hypothetical protein DPMN_178479 [Dreissena polymorpha]
MEVDAEGSSDHEGGGGMAATHGLMRELAGALKEVVSELQDSKVPKSLQQQVCGKRRCTNRLSKCK